MFLHNTFLSNDETGIPMQTVKTNSAPVNLVALSEDGTYGIRNWTNGVEVYVRSGDTYTLQATLLASDHVSGDGFGSKYCISDDGQYVFVDATLATVSGLTYAGAVYVFTRSGSSWSQQAKITEPTPLANSGFGISGTGGINNKPRGLVDRTGTRVMLQGYNGSSIVTYMFARSGSIWSLEYSPPYSGHIDGSGTYYAYASAGGLTVNVMVRSGSTWSLQQAITVWGGSGYGTAWVHNYFSGSGDVLLCTRVDGSSRPISISCFTRVGTTWSPAPAPNDNTVGEIVGVPFTSNFESMSLSADGNLALLLYTDRSLAWSTHIVRRHPNESFWQYVGRYDGWVVPQSDGLYALGPTTATTTSRISTYGFV